MKEKRKGLKFTEERSKGKKKRLRERIKPKLREETSSMLSFDNDQSRVIFAFLKTHTFLFFQSDHPATMTTSLKVAVLGHVLNIGMQNRLIEKKTGIV